MAELKQVIVVRSDLKLSPGKLAVQVAHASIGAFVKSLKSVADSWLKQGMKKVVLKVETFDELLAIKKKAGVLKLATELITDAGRTEIEPGTITCIGIGPAEETVIDKVTGTLKMI